MDKETLEKTIIDLVGRTTGLEADMANLKDLVKTVRATAISAAVMFLVTALMEVLRLVH